MADHHAKRTVDLPTLRQHANGLSYELLGVRMQHLSGEWVDELVLRHDRAWQRVREIEEAEMVNRRQAQ
jgi:hypothetical protein